MVRTVGQIKYLLVVIKKILSHFQYNSKACTINPRGLNHYRSKQYVDGTTKRNILAVRGVVRSNQ